MKKKKRENISHISWCAGVCVFRWVKMFVDSTTEWVVGWKILFLFSKNLSFFVHSVRNKLLVKLFLFSVKNYLNKKFCGQTEFPFFRKVVGGK